MEPGTPIEKSKNMLIGELLTFELFKSIKRTMLVNFYKHGNSLFSSRALFHDHGF